MPSALASAELGAAIPDEGGAYVWVRNAFGRFAGTLTSLLYWAGTPLWLGGSVTIVAIAVFERFLADLSTSGHYVFGAVFVGVATVGAVVPLKYGKWVPSSGAIGQIALLVFFTVSVAAYGVQHGVHGIVAGDFAPSYAVFIAVVPVLLYSFVGIELPCHRRRGDGRSPPRHPGRDRAGRRRADAHVRGADPRGAVRPASRADHLAARSDRRDGTGVHGVRRIRRP